MLSRKDFNSAELETVQGSQNPITVMAANGEVQTHEVATVYVKELDLFVTAKLLEDTLADTNGPVVSYHISSKKKKTEGYNAIKKTTCRSLSPDCRTVLPVRLQVLPQQRHRRTQFFLHRVQQAHDVRVQAVLYWETC